MIASPASALWAQGLRGGADPTLAEICKRESRALVTLDLDFADIRTYPPAEYPSQSLFSWVGRM